LSRRGNDGSTSDLSVPEPLRARDDVREVDTDDIEDIRKLSSGSSTTDEGDR
jgi:hypothetical protein